MTVCAWDVLRMWAGLQWSSECSGSLGGQWVRDAEQVGGSSENSYVLW
jgi:hypothetical protein